MKTAGAKLLAVCAVCMLFSGCSAKGKPSAAETSLLFKLKHASFYFRAPKVKDPLPANGEVVAQGAEIYSNSCAVCHNVSGRGTALGLSMYPPAADLTSEYAQGYSDAELYWIVQNGVGTSGMPAFPDLKPGQTWQVIHFLRTLPGASKPSAMPPENQAAVQLGHQLFKTQGCVACHSIDGTESDGPDLSKEGDRGHSDAWLIGHTIHPERYTPGSQMPDFDELNGKQLEALAVFLNSLKAGTAPQTKPGMSNN